MAVTATIPPTTQPAITVVFEDEDEEGDADAVLDADREVEVGL